MRTLLEAGRGKIGAPASHSEISISVALVWSLRAGTDVNWVERLQDEIISLKVGLESGSTLLPVLCPFQKKKLSSLMVFSKIYHKIYTNKSPNFSTLSYFREIPQTARIPDFRNGKDPSFHPGRSPPELDARCRVLGKSCVDFAEEKESTISEGPESALSLGVAWGEGADPAFPPAGGHPLELNSLTSSPAEKQTQRIFLGWWERRGRGGPENAGKSRLSPVQIPRVFLRAGVFSYSNPPPLLLPTTLLPHLRLMSFGTTGWYQ